MSSYKPGDTIDYQTKSKDNYRLTVLSVADPKLTDKKYYVIGQQVKKNGKLSPSGGLYRLKSLNESTWKEEANSLDKQINEQKGKDMKWIKDQASKLGVLNIGKYKIFGGRRTRRRRKRRKRRSRKGGNPTLEECKKAFPNMIWRGKKPRPRVAPPRIQKKKMNPDLAKKMVQNYRNKPYNLNRQYSDNGDVEDAIDDAFSTARVDTANKLQKLRDKRGGKKKRKRTKKKKRRRRKRTKKKKR
jgi:hypothetical protein